MPVQLYSYKYVAILREQGQISGQSEEVISENQYSRCKLTRWERDPKKAQSKKV